MFIDFEIIKLFENFHLKWFVPSYSINWSALGRVDYFKTITRWEFSKIE